MRFTVLTAAAAIVLAGCGGDGSGPSGGSSLSTQQTAVLSTALSAHGGIGSAATAFAPYIFGQLKSFGTISEGNSVVLPARAALNKAVSLAVASINPGTFDAAATQVKYTVNFGGVSESGVISSVLGWQGINTSANTVDKLLTTSLYTSGTTFPTTGTATIGSDDAIATYYDNSSTSLYGATSGTFNLTSTDFTSGTHSCSVSQQGITVTCSYSTGTMAGNFNFGANRASGTGATTYTQATTNYNLPAVQLTITVSQ